MNGAPAVIAGASGELAQGAATAPLGNRRQPQRRVPGTSSIGRACRRSCPILGSSKPLRGRARRPGEVEAGGIEPPSAAAPVRASTSVARAFPLARRPAREPPSAEPAILRSRPFGDWLSVGASPLSDAASGPRASSERRVA